MTRAPSIVVMASMITGERPFLMGSPTPKVKVLQLKAKNYEVLTEFPFFPIERIFRISIHILQLFLLYIKGIIHKRCLIKGVGRSVDSSKGDLLNKAI